MSITKRIDDITAISPERCTELPPVPKSVKIELTARCDFNCFFCASGQRLREKSDMALEDFQRYATDMRAAGVEELGLFYLGESFILKNLADYVRFAKQELGFPYVFLTTNGRLATPLRVKDVMRAGLDSLKFSFNAADPMEFKAVTGVKPSEWFGIIDNIRQAHGVRAEVEYESGHRCGLYASSIQYDGKQQERMELAVGLIRKFVDEHYWLPLYNQAALVTEGIGAKGFVPTAGNQGRCGALRQPVPCWSAFTEGHVTWDGKLSACCFDHSEAWQMGDLNQQTFMEAWHSCAFASLRHAHITQDLTGTPCAQCVAYA